MSTELPAINITPDELHQILKEYAYDPDIFNDEDERSLEVKRVMSALPEADKIIFCLYLELGSSRKLGELLGGVSHSTILKEVTRIKTAITNKMVRKNYI